jgi:hypothetical protein
LRAVSIREAAERDEGPTQFRVGEAQEVLIEVQTRPAGAGVSMIFRLAVADRADHQFFAIVRPDSGENGADLESIHDQIREAVAREIESGRRTIENAQGKIECAWFGGNLASSFGSQGWR